MGRRRVPSALDAYADRGIGIQSEIAHADMGAPLHDQIVRHVGNDGAPLRLVRNDTEIVS